MEIASFVRRLSALAQASRLKVFRLLVVSGLEGVASGDIARKLGITPNTLSTQLGVLANAGMVSSRREGRSIIYAADYDAMGELLVYLMEDCCQGRPEICERAARAATRGACASLPTSTLERV